MNYLPLTVKGICRRFRKWMHKNGMFSIMPLSGPFSLKIKGTIVNDPTKLPKKINPKDVEVLVGTVPGTVQTFQPPAMAIVQNTEPDRELFKKIVKEADPLKGTRKRTDYRKAKNPKTDDGVQYYAKVDGKWREVPTEYMNPRYQLAA